MHRPSPLIRETETAIESYMLDELDEEAMKNLVRKARKEATDEDWQYLVRETVKNKLEIDSKISSKFTGPKNFNTEGHRTRAEAAYQLILSPERDQN